MPFGDIEDPLPAHTNDCVSCGQEGTVVGTLTSVPTGPRRNQVTCTFCGWIGWRYAGPVADRLSPFGGAGPANPQTQGGST